MQQWLEIWPINLPIDWGLPTFMTEHHYNSYDHIKNMISISNTIGFHVTNLCDLNLWLVDLKIKRHAPFSPTIITICMTVGQKVLKIYCRNFFMQKPQNLIFYLKIIGNLPFIQGNHNINLYDYRSKRFLYIMGKHNGKYFMLKATFTLTLDLSKSTRKSI